MTPQRLLTSDTDLLAKAPHPLRLTIAGSAGAGRSTLLGRLLHAGAAVSVDQWEAVRAESRRHGALRADAALLTDGPRAPQAQGGTSAVDHRRSATPRRRIILADATGDPWSTRDAATGMSRADLAVVVVDARQGLVEETLRHAALAALFRVPRVVLAVNKADLAGFSANLFDSLAAEFRGWTALLGMDEVRAVPVAALSGDNVIRPARSMSWYDGPTLLRLLEETPSAAADGHGPVRLPVQYVLHAPDASPGSRPSYAGRLASGALHAGQRVTVLPSGLTSTVRSISVLGRPARAARAPQSVDVRLADDIDVGRGDMLVAGGSPEVTTETWATVCHLHERRLRPGDRVLVRHSARTVRARVVAVTERLDPQQRAWSPAGELAADDIGRILLRTAEPLAWDPYRTCRETGSFLLLDPTDGATLTAGTSADTPPAAEEPVLREDVRHAPWSHPQN
jgi:sulfate adenylyltransferase subunit 1